MSERTTIGGVTYESVGSSNSNLLLKCNGTARIQWGNKLIDLIKNGKIVTSSGVQIYIISNESDIQSDGIYVIVKENLIQLWICKNKNKYNLSESTVQTLARRVETIEQLLGINQEANTQDSNNIVSNFNRGMIILYSGEIPEGWGICNGQEYEYNNVKTLSPNLSAPTDEINYIIKL